MLRSSHCTLNTTRQIRTSGSVGTTRLIRAGLVALVAATALGACGQSTGSTSATSPEPGGSAATASTQTSTNSASSTSGLVISNAWVKATTGTMTGMFGTLTNTTDHPVTVVKATSPGADMVQLHITVKDAGGAMVMKQTHDGFTVPAKGSVELKPGGNHVMLMELRQPVLSGTSTEVTLTTDSGATLRISAPGREFSGAKETYASGTEGSTGASPAPTSGH